MYRKVLNALLHSGCSAVAHSCIPNMYPNELKPETRGLGGYNE